MIELLAKIIGKIRWPWLYRAFTGRQYGLMIEDHDKIKQVLKRGDIVLTWRSSHLSSYFIAAGHYLLTGRFTKWSHVLITVSDSDDDFVEAIGIGVVDSKFSKIFDCEACAILRPKMPDGIDWTLVIGEALNDIGHKYDYRFNLKDASEFSCVELVLDALKRIPDYESRLHGLLAMIKNEGQLTPPMYYECGSFDVVLEIRRD